MIRLLALALIAVGFVVACGGNASSDGDDHADTSTQPVRETSSSEPGVSLTSSSAAGVTDVAPVATEPPPLATWETRESESPLATWDPSTETGYPDAASGQGVLDISDDCALLILPNQKVILPVWPEPTAWNPSTHAIEFVGIGGERIELRDGDRITLGGYTPTRPRQFVVPPDPSCDADELFIVNSIVVTD